MGSRLRVISEVFLEGVLVLEKNGLILERYSKHTETMVDQAEHRCKYRGWRRTYHILSTMNQAVRVVDKAKETTLALAATSNV